MLISYYANKKSSPRLPSWQPSLIFFNIPIESGTIIKPCTLKHFQVTYMLHKAGYWTIKLAWSSRYAPRSSPETQHRKCINDTVNHGSEEVWQGYHSNAELDTAGNGSGKIKMLTIGGFNPHECGLLTKKNGSRNMEISYIVSLGNCDFFFKLTIIGSDNGLSPARRQAIIWTNDGILLIGPLGTNVSEILIEIYTFLFKKMRLKLSSAKWWPFCLGLSVLFNHARGYPASREMLDRRWANVITYVGAMSANDVGPTWICPSVQRWHNVITPPTMTLCQRNNLLHFVIFDGLYYVCTLFIWMVG